MRVKVIEIKDKDGVKRRDHYSRQRLNEIGCIYHLKIGDCLIFKYENIFKEHQFMLTTFVRHIEENERYITVKTERSIYKFKKM